MKLEKLIHKFKEKYGKKGNRASIFFAPGRINLIGEHTDYNGGFVFPCALNIGTYLIIRKTNDHIIKFATTNFDFSINIPIKEINKKQDKKWVNYPLGIIAQFIKKGVSITGIELLYSGNIPNEAGLSSSASIELVTSIALNQLFGSNFNMLELIKLSKKAENEFVGVNCGIMDQFAVGMGEKDFGIFLNCNTLEYELVPVDLSEYKFVIANTNKTRGLADSKYNERVFECKKAVNYLSKVHFIHNLCELEYSKFNEIKDVIPDELIKKRARHVISENQRVIEAVEAIKNGELIHFGKLMNASHNSLRDDYEVTGIELDTLVEEARKIDGVIGSRMTGAGFGGCTLSLMEEKVIDKFIFEVGRNYEKKIGLKANFYIVEIGDGARKIEYC